MSTAFIHNEAPGAMVVAAGGVNWHKVDSISRWTRKRADRPRYYVTSGREPLGTVFETRGIFTAVDPDGNLIAVSSSLRNAVDPLCPMTGASS
jgi:hypothetical protein